MKGPKDSKEIRKLINECDNLINGLDSDLVLARSGLMGFKRQKVSNYIKDVRELIRDCDEFITRIESDLAQTRRKLKGSNATRDRNIIKRLDNLFENARI